MQPNCHFRFTAVQAGEIRYKFDVCLCVGIFYFIHRLIQFIFPVVIEFYAAALDGQGNNAAKQVGFEFFGNRCLRVNL